MALSKCPNGRRFNEPMKHCDLIAIMATDSESALGIFQTKIKEHILLIRRNYTQKC